MKVSIILSLLFVSSVSAWKTDRRCMREGQLLAGDEVDQKMLENGAVVEDDEEFEMFDLFDAFEHGVFHNQSSYSNTTRHLQSGREFNLKLYWKTGACWQDEWTERKWCMGCRRSCNNGDVLEIKSCSKNWKQRFQWQDGKIKVSSKNMCLTRSGNSLRLRSCSGGSNQKFSGYSGSGGFRLKPSGSGRCVTQHHHPKAGEVVELYDCGLAAQHNTDKWNVYWPSGGGGSSSGGGGGGGGGGDDNDNDNGGGGGGNQLTRKTCSSNKPCGKCEGDCDNDNDCQGSLKCFQRYGNNALAQVPGCSGTGRKGTDYCY